MHQHLVLVHGEGHIRWLIHCSTDHMVLKLVPVKISLQENRIVRLCSDRQTPVTLKMAPCRSHI